MRKEAFNKWIILFAFLTISISAFAVLAYKESRQTCQIMEEDQPPRVPEKGEMLLDAFSRQFTSFVALP